MAELSEKNNRRTLRRCARETIDEEDPDYKDILWVEVPESRAGQDADMPRPANHGQLKGAIDDAAKCVLYLIKREARRRAERGAGTVAGSHFVDVLRTAPP